MTAKEEPVTIPKASEIKKETNISISSKIRQIEQSVNSAEALKEMRKKVSIFDFLYVKGILPQSDKFKKVILSK